MIRRVTFAATLAAALALAVSVASASAPTTGAWKGKVVSESGDSTFKPLTFKVLRAGHELKGFLVHVSSYCYGSGGVIPYTIYIPKAPIKDGKIDHVYREPSADLKDTLRGKVGKHDAHGTVHVEFTGCGAKFTWSASPK